MKTTFFPGSPSLLLLLAFTVGCGATVSPPNDDDAGFINNEAGVADVGAGSDTPRPLDEAIVPREDVPISPPRDVPVVQRDAGPLTECDPANDGLRCGPVGTGCGSSGGGGACSPSSQCNCGANERWSCTVSPLPPFCDGGVSPVDVTNPPDDTGPGPTCALAGVYEASFEGQALYFTFTPDGRWLGSIGINEPAAVQGTYTLAGDVLTMTNETGMSGGGCLVSDRGVYRTEYRDGCRSLDLVRISDDCGSRGDTLDQLAFTRQ